MDRRTLASATQAAGNQVNQLREALNRSNAPFLAGLVRAAEEALVVVNNALQDASIPESDL